MVGMGGGTHSGCRPGLTALPLLLPTEPPRGHGYLDRSWEEPLLSTGEMLAEWAEWAEGRCAACLLGEVDCDRALALVRERERRFFFFSWGLLKGTCSSGHTQGLTRGQCERVRSLSAQGTYTLGWLELTVRLRMTLSSSPSFFFLPPKFWDYRCTVTIGLRGTGKLNPGHRACS